MADLRLKFFNKRGNPLNFEYIGPTGPTPLDSKFLYKTNFVSSSNGDVIFQQSGSNYTFQLNEKDLNFFDIIEWATEVDYFIQRGAEVYFEGKVLSGNQFKGKVSSCVISGSTVTITIPVNNLIGQNIISGGNTIFFNTTYKNRPGGYFAGNIYFDPVSAGLYENEQIFITQEVVGPSGGTDYSYPRTLATGATAGKWRTRWNNNTYGNIDVTEILFTYKILDELEGGDGQPLIVSYPNIVYNDIIVSPSDYYSNGNLNSPTFTTSESQALSVNVALNGPEEAEEVYERKLIIEDISAGITGANVSKILEVNFYGQIVGEDERLKVLANNLGRSFDNQDSIILRNHDPKEPLPNYEEINEKRKELLLAGEEIFPYVGSYKGLINALKFFGYQDLRIKEYWLNLQFVEEEDLIPPAVKNQEVLNDIKTQRSQTGTQSYQIKDVLDNPNSGKYRLEQTYGPDAEGNYVLDISSQNTLVPSNTYKKTSLFGLYYDLNKVTTEMDEYGYPVVVDSFQFTQEEVLIKLFGLKEKLKREYLPLNARIVDITGEGVYFSVVNTRSWVDRVDVIDTNSGKYFDFSINPDLAYIEDLRNFNIRPDALPIQTPSVYYDSYSIGVNVLGGTGSALYFSGFPDLGITGPSGPNLPLTVVSGKSYNFNLSTEGFTFYITESPSFTQQDPVGLTGNGATSGGLGITWYVNPQQTSPVYYYCSENPLNINGVINVLPSELSDLGNIINPLDFQQNYTAAQNESLINSINEFYTLKQEGKIQLLGDGKYDPPSYVDPTTNLLYKNPIGTPTVLELELDRWTWDEMNFSWSGINLPTFKVGDFVEIKPLTSSLTAGITGGVITSVTINGEGLGYSSVPIITVTGGGGVGAVLVPVITGTRITSITILSGGSGYTSSPSLSISSPSGDSGSVVSTNYVNGTYDVLLSSNSLVYTFEGFELFSGNQEYGFMNWKNIDFSNLVEIEWIINKDATQSGTPYNFVFRGPVTEFYQLAHFIPFTGDFSVTCNLYDGFNAKSTKIKNKNLIVQPKRIKLESWASEESSSWTRYREVEKYIWENVFRGWDDYESIWEYPAEGNSEEKMKNLIPKEILDFAFYGNKAEEGQDVYVKVKTDPIGATGEIQLLQSFLTINEIYSLEITPAQYGYATVSTTTPHGLNTGDYVYISNTIQELSGSWEITVTSTTEFKIKTVLEISWYGVIPSISPNRLQISSGSYPSQKITGSGFVSVTVGTTVIGSTIAGESLYNTTNYLVSSINNLTTYPDYFAYCTDPTTNPTSIIIHAPDELGSTQNGTPMAVSTSGLLSTNYYDPTLENGISPLETYEYWSESSDKYPNENLKFWGTKRLNWDIFYNNTWEDGYAHSWFDFEFNNDWLGGFELHNLSIGDLISVSSGILTPPDTKNYNALDYSLGFYGITGSTIQEIANELNGNSNSYIGNYDYRPIPNETGAFSSDSPPINIGIQTFTPSVSPYPAPPSVPV
jgi:hypothetical protein